MSTMVTSQPTPERLFNTLVAFQQTAALKTAIQLDIFTAIAEGNTVASAIASRSKAAERGVRILCDYLTVQGLLNKADGRYRLTPDAALFLDRHSPAYMGSIAEFLTGKEGTEQFERLPEAVRNGGTPVEPHAFEPDHPMWVLFARAMRPLMQMPSEIMAQELTKAGKVHKVLDVAAGHGIFGIAVAKLNPEAHIYAADWPKVLAVALENAQAAGVGGRYHSIPGSAFETEFGDGYDLVLIPNFLHHFDAAANTSLLRKVHRALRVGGRAAILEFVPNPDRVSPPTAAAFGLIMLAATPAGDAYPFEELKAMAEQAGFRRVELSEAPVGVESLVVAYK